MIWTVRQLDNLKGKDAASNMRPFSPMVNDILLGLTSVEMKIASANKFFGVTCVGEGKI